MKKDTKNNNYKLLFFLRLLFEGKLYLEGNSDHQGISSLLVCFRIYGMIEIKYTFHNFEIFETCGNGMLITNSFFFAFYHLSFQLTNFWCSFYGFGVKKASQKLSYYIDRRLKGQALRITEDSIEFSI
jgi:hypothetical protein